MSATTTRFGGFFYGGGNMADGDIQGLLVRIEATTEQLRQEMARGESSVSQTANRIDSSLGRIDSAFDRTGSNASLLQKAVSGAFTGIGVASAAAVAGLVAITVKTTEYAREMQNLASVSNTSVTDFQRLAAGAKTVGVEQEKLADVFKDVNDRVGEFMQRGGGEMADFFKEIAPKVGVTTDQLDSLTKTVGVTIAQFADLSGPDALQLYYNSLEQAGLNQQQVTTYMEAMADEATALVPLLKNNGAGFKELGDQAERTGKILSEIDTQRLVDVDQAVKNLQGSINGATNRLVLGALPGIESVTDRLTDMANNGAIDVLATGISFLADNLNVLAVIFGGKLAAAFASYLVDLAKSAAATVQATVANKANAASEVVKAEARLRSAQTAVFLAEKEAIAARGTAVQTEMSIALAQARTVERAATERLAIAQAGLSATGTGLLGLLGGPAGLVALAVGAGIAFLTMRDHTSTLEKKLGDIAEPVDRLIERFNKLNRATQAVTLRALQEEVEETQQALTETAGAIADQFESDLHNVGAAGADGLIAGLAPLPDDVQQALDLVRKGARDTSAGLVVDWKAIADEVRKVPGVSESMAQSIEKGQVPVSDLAASLQDLKGKVSALTSELDANTKSQNENNESRAAADQIAKDAADKYIGKLDEQLTKLKDKTAAEQASTWLAENRISVESELGKRVLEHARAIDVQKESDKRATDAANQAAQAAKKAASEEEGRSKALTDLKAQADIVIASATGLAAAYLAGTDKSREFAVQQKVEEALLKTGAGARDQVTAALKAQMAAEDALAVSKKAYDLKQEASDLIDQAKATLQGAAALEAFNTQQAIKNALQGKSIDQSSETYKNLVEQTKAQVAANKALQQAGKVEGIIDRLAPETKLLRDYTEEQEVLNEAMKLYPERASEYQEALRLLGIEYEQNRNAATAWGKFTEGAVDRVDGAFADAWKNIGEGFDGFATNLKEGFKQLLAELAHMAITKPIIMQIGAALGVGGMSAQSSGLLGSAGGSNLGSLWNAANSGYNALTSGLGKAVTAGWNTGEGFLGGLQNAISNGGSYISNGLSGLFGGTGAGSAATGATQAGYTSTQFSNWVAAQNTTWGSAASGFGAVAGGIGGAIQGYQAAGLKGAVAGGVGGWGGATAGTMLGTAAASALSGTALGATIGSILPGIGTVIGAALGAAFGSKLFGGAWETKDAGFSLGVSGGDLSAQQFEYQKKKGGLFSSNKKRTRYSALDSDTQSALDQSYEATIDSVFDLFDQLNVTLNDGVLDGLSIAATQISTKDKTAEQIQQEITAWFGTVADTVTSTINDATSAGLGGYTFEGLTAFVNNLLGVNDIFTTLNLSLYDSSVAGGKLAESLSAMAGGLENLQTITSTYYDAFYTDVEKADNVLAAVRKQFANIDIDFPDTREAFRAVVDGIDRTTEAGQQMFLTLTGLSGNAAAAYSVLEQRAAEATASQQAMADNYYALFTTDAEKAADKLLGVRAEFVALGTELPKTRAAFMEMVYAAEQGAVAGTATADALKKLATDADAAYDIIEARLMDGANAAFAAVQRSINAQRDALNTTLADVNTRVSDLTSISSSLDAALKALRGTSTDAVRMLRSQAQATLQSALAIARAGGSLAGFEGLTDALDVLSSNNTDLYGSLEDFNRDQGRTANAVSDLEKLNGKQLTSAQQSAKALQDQLTRLDEQLAFAQSQLDALNGVDNSVKTVEEAVAAMNLAVVAALAAMSTGSATSNTKQNNDTIIQSIYRSVLGRDADAGGLAFWSAALQNGSLNYSQIVDAITKSARENGQIPAHANGGYISGPGTGTSDSILARLSNGEYVMRSAAVRAYGTDVLDAMNGLQMPAFADGGPVLTLPTLSQPPAVAQQSSMRGKEQDQATLAELRKLRQDINDGLSALAGHARKTSDNTGQLAEVGTQIVGTVQTKVVA